MQALRVSRERLTDALAMAPGSQATMRTLDGYRPKLEHAAEYFASAHGLAFDDVTSSAMLRFIRHLERPGGTNPHEERVLCDWCRTRGYPDGTTGSGWAPSTRKAYIVALNLLYGYCRHEGIGLQSDPMTAIQTPRVPTGKQFIPTPDEMNRLLDAKGKPRDRAITYLLTYAPSRRATVTRALWRDFDLERGHWYVPETKGGTRSDTFELHPELRAVLRGYRNWQEIEASRHPQMKAALSDPDTAYVFMTRNGRPMTGDNISQTLKRRAVRAGVAVIPATGLFSGVDGMTSKISPHALRRGWASAALNDPENPVPVEIVQLVLGHKDVSTTLRHYAVPKSERAQEALRKFQLRRRP